MKRSPVQSEEDLAEAGEGATMGFLDHLEELRWTLFKAAAAFFAAVVVIVIFLAKVTYLLNRPYELAKAALDVEMGALITDSPMGVFTALIQIGVLGGFGLSIPLILYFLARFIAPALKKDEIRILLPSCLAALILFLGGVSFSYFFIVPKALEFSIRLNQMMGYGILWTADRYYSLLVWTTLGMGFCFQFPLVVYILVYLRIVTTAALTKARRYMIVIFFFLGALLTPTWDPFTQAMVALPMWLLYELSVFLARRMEVRRNAEFEASFEDEEELE